MRVSEYTSARKDRNDHNIVHDAFHILDEGFGVSFWSDKTSHLDPTPKHRTIPWGFLPDFARSLMEEYRDARPREARYYFVHEDGQPLDYTEFVDLLQTCLLHTSYRMLHVGPHGLRIGGASSARLAGVNILQVRYLGRWTSTSNTIDHYTRTAFVSMPPDRIYEEVKRYRKVWQYPRLAFLARNVVQTGSPSQGVHPHEMMLKEHFPVFYTRCSALLPRSYPASNVVNKLRERKIQAPVRLRQLQNQSLLEERDKERRLVAVARARQDARRARNSAVATSSSGVVTLAQARQLTDTTGKRWSCGTQTRPAPVRSLSSQTPRRRLVEARTGPGVPMDYLPNFAAVHHGAPFPAQAREVPSQSEESLVSGPSVDSVVQAEVPGTPSQAPGTPGTSSPAAQLPVTPRMLGTPERSGLRRSGRKRKFRFDPATIFSPQAEKKRKGILKTPSRGPVRTGAATSGGGAGPSGMALSTPPGAGRSRSATLYQLRVAMLRKSRSSVAPKSFRGTRVLRTVYEVQVDGRMRLVTREEYQAMFPGERVPTLSAMAKQNRSVTARLRRRLSRRYRDQRQAFEDRHRMKAKHVKGADYAIPSVRLTNTMSRLLDHFFDSVIKWPSGSSGTDR